MATASPFHFPPEPPASGRSVELGRAYAEHLQRRLYARHESAEDTRMRAVLSAWLFVAGSRILTVE